jgi:hypothetical protein
MGSTLRCKSEEQLRILKAQDNCYVITTERNTPKPLRTFFSLRVEYPLDYDPSRCPWGPMTVTPQSFSPSLLSHLSSKWLPSKLAKTHTGRESNKQVLSRPKRPTLACIVARPRTIDA